MPRPLQPQPLHLLRLAQSAPGQWVQLPGSVARVLGLSGKISEQVGGSLLCLAGEAVVDLPTGAFVHLRTGELFQGAGAWEALALREGTVLLQWPEEAGLP